MAASLTFNLGHSRLVTIRSMAILLCDFVLSDTRVPRPHASLKSLDAIDQRPPAQNVAEDVACDSEIDAVQDVDHGALQPKTTDLQKTRDVRSRRRQPREVPLVVHGGRAPARVP